MTRRTWIRRTACGATIVAALTAAVVVAAPGASSAAPPPTATTGGFQDHSSNDYLRIQLDPAAPGYGGFIVAVPGVGLAWGEQPATARRESDHAVQLRYDGGGFLNAGAQLDTEFGVAYQPNGTSTKIRLRLVGSVDPAHGTGSIELWVNDVHYRFAAASAPQNAGTTADTVLAAIVRGDWSALYDLADDSLRAGGTAAEFTAQVQQQFAANNKVTSAHTTGTISYSTNAAGVTYASVPVSMTAVLDGATQTMAGTLVMIYNQGRWRWFTVDPAAG